MTYETRNVFFGSGDGDTPGRFHIAIQTNEAIVRGVVTADSADEAVRAAKAHVADVFCTVKSITKLPDGIDIAKPGVNGPVVNFIIDEKGQPLESRLDKDLKLLCKGYMESGMCSPDQCEDCPISGVLEMMEALGPDSDKDEEGDDE